MRIGILGGTFDPPHLGHLRFAEAAHTALNLDEVVLMPANRNPQKASNVASGRQRLEMARLLTPRRSWLAVSDLEITRGGKSYAVDTLQELHMANPGAYWFLVGADAIRDLPQWKQPERLVKLCRLGVALRWPLIEAQVLGALPDEFESFVDFVPMQPANISSTELRERLSKEMPVAPWIEPEVIQYIKEQGLYKGLNDD